MTVNLEPISGAISASLQADLATLSAEPSYNMALGVVVLAIIYPDYGALRLLVPDTAITASIRNSLLGMETGQSLGTQELLESSATVDTVEFQFSRTSLTESGATGTYGYVTAFNTASSLTQSGSTGNGF